MKYWLIFWKKIYFKPFNLLFLFLVPILLCVVITSLFLAAVLYESWITYKTVSRQTWNIPLNTIKPNQGGTNSPPGFKNLVSLEPKVGLTSKPGYKKITSCTTEAQGCKFLTILNNLIYIEPFSFSWFILINLGLSRPILVHLGLSWFSLVYLDLFWFILVYLGLSWVILGHFRQKWDISGYLELSRAIWSSSGYNELFLAISGNCWLSLAVYSYLWLSLSSIKYQGKVEARKTNLSLFETFSFFFYFYF